ncbi:hypothetical protein PL321_04225 [Caloramator sp. mosi_1]|uniref:hypothetical protein n=1 Tax=Caloramator sp. mosi_1 TaxID=3023090 RepID=UPI002362A50C|nr:hypothetical protein [Caloramator sp. mosi_1]WDC84831.1 hypothetical protein PL321_04225 [Caloramator sp. mosi_1]
MYSVLFSIIISNYFISALFSFTVCVLPIAIVRLLNILLVNIFIGNYDELKDIILPHLFPFSVMADKTLELFTVKDISLFLISIIFIGILSYLLFKYRRNEDINRIVVFKFLEPVFAYIATFILMILFAILIMNTTYKSFLGLVISCLIGAFLGYYISQMVLHKELVVFRYFKGFYIYVFFMLIALFILCKTNIVYRHTPPKVNAVEGAYVTKDYHKFITLEKIILITL